MKSSRLVLSILLCVNVLSARNSYDDLITQQIWKQGTPLRLHLGCGTGHLNGYINVDLSAADHTVQQKSGADYFANIRTLNFPNNSVDEIRSHHFFEHFERADALAMLSLWHQWLRMDGILVIETPDLERSLPLLTDPNSTFETKQAVVRCLFGSQEAFWAIHYDAWWAEKFTRILTALGFEILSIEHTSHCMIRSVTVHAKKVKSFEWPQMVKLAKHFLRDYMIDNSASETQQWLIWCSAFDTFIKKARENA